MKAPSLVGLLLVAMALSGCVATKEGEIQQWMANERNQARPNYVPLPPPKPFVPEVYGSSNAVEPFSNLKLTQALQRDAAQAPASNALVKPELTRRKEPLEAFPIDAMKLVGSITKAGRPIALVRIDNLLHQVSVGQHLGLNYGKVIKITETEVTIREIVQDAVGEWIERPAMLQLQEKAK